MAAKNKKSKAVKARKATPARPKKKISAPAAPAPAPKVVSVPREFAQSPTSTPAAVPAEGDTTRFLRREVELQEHHTAIHLYLREIGQ